MTVNDPETVAELQALYPQYEAALMANDAETLTRMFWSSPHAMRFGVTENLYGIDEIESFRKGRSPANLARSVKRLDVVTFGRDFGSVTLEFERTVDGRSHQAGKARCGCDCRKAGGLFPRTCPCCAEVAQASACGILSSAIEIASTKCHRLKPAPLPSALAYRDRKGFHRSGVKGIL